MTQTTQPGQPAYLCPFCRTATDPTGVDCTACGAAFDVRRVVSTSGWVKQPPIRDMARLKAGQTQVQIAGNFVPVTEFALADQDWIYFSHHVLLHADASVKLANLPMKGAWSRMRAGLPVFMLSAQGPGRIALSYDKPGETIAVPLQAGQTMDVTEHRLLAATGAVTYGYEQSGVWIETVTTDAEGDTEREWHYPMGQYIDRFTAAQGPGLLLLHAPGNVMIRDLAHGEEIMAQPDSLVYKDPSVQTSLHLEYPNGAGQFSWRGRSAMHQWLRLTGPGRIAISSVYEHPEPLKGRLDGGSYYTVQQW